MNNEYRTGASIAAKESYWTIWKFLPILMLIVAIVFGLRSLGLIGGTIVDQEVFKQSFQYKEGMEQRAAIMQANIIGIDVLLRSNPENKQDLINQKAILKAQLRAITINQ